MPSSKDEPDTADAHYFHLVGPKDITAANNADWSDEEYRRCLAACIAKGTSVYANEKHKELASPWWTTFNFKLHEEIKGHHDGFMFGAIYKYDGERPHQCTPAYVIAFRGTMLAHSKPLHDLYHDLKVIINDLRNCCHFKLACQKIRELVKASGDDTPVWLVGHSLGAALALDVGRCMIDSGYNLPTFLFNPPQVSMAPVIDLLLQSDKAKDDLLASSFKLKDFLGKTIMRKHTESMVKLFEKLLPWEPSIYVHEEDIICQGFIDYFVQREKLADRYPLAMMLSYRDMCSFVFGEDKEQPHLLPSAKLCIVTKHSHSEDPHALKQWWMPNTELGWSNDEDTQKGKSYTWKSPKQG